MLKLDTVPFQAIAELFRIFYEQKRKKNYLKQLHKK